MVRSLSLELQKKAEDELNEIPKQTYQDIQYIHNWILQQPHLHNVIATDQWILNFLRGCKFRLEKTKEKLDKYYASKTLLPELYSNRDPFLPGMQKMLDLGCCLPLRGTAGKAGPRVIIIRTPAEDPSNIIFDTVLKSFMMITDILLKEDDNFVIAGQQVVIDYNGASINHMAAVNLVLSKKAVMCLQNAYPSRPKGCYCLNVPSFFEGFFNVFKPILKEKIQKRINVYSTNNSEDIFKIIPRSLLPKEYGGDGESVAYLTAYWKKKVESYRDWFLEDSKYHSDEAKRPGRQLTESDMFGVEGSFRRLNVD